jgi:hypothetical protein
MLNYPPDAHTIANLPGLALQQISQARQILKQLVTSSESFDYPKAKQALIDLQQMIRQLGREEARLRASLPHTNSTLQSDCAKVLPFPFEQNPKRRA